MAHPGTNSRRGECLTVSAIIIGCIVAACWGGCASCGSNSKAKEAARVSQERQEQRQAMYEAQQQQEQGELQRLCQTRGSLLALVRACPNPLWNPAESPLKPYRDALASLLDQYNTASDDRVMSEMGRPLLELRKEKADVERLIALKWYPGEWAKLRTSAVLGEAFIAYRDAYVDETRMNGVNPLPRLPWQRPTAPDTPVAVAETYKGMRDRFQREWQAAGGKPSDRPRFPLLP